MTTFLQSFFSWLGFSFLLFRAAYACIGVADTRFPERYCSPECTRVCRMEGAQWSMVCLFAKTAKYTKFDLPINPYFTNNTHMTVMRKKEFPSRPAVDTLYLRDLRFEDNGVYRCTGVNRDCTAMLTGCVCLAVSRNLSDHQRCEADIRPRIFPSNQTNCTATEGQASLLLTCYSTVNTAGVRNFWWHNGRSHRLRRENGETLKLVNISREDAGNYTCQLGTTDGKTMFDIIHFYVEVNQVERNSTVSYPIRELSTRLLSCMLPTDTGAVNRNVIWFHGASPILPGKKGATVAPGGFLLVDFSKLNFRRSTELSCRVQGLASHMTYAINYLPPLAPGRPGRTGDFILVGQHRDTAVRIVVNTRFQEKHMTLTTSHVIERRLMWIDPRRRLQPEEACYVSLHGKRVDVTVTLQYKNRNGDVSPKSEPVNWIYKPDKRVLNHHTVSLYMRQRTHSCPSTTSSRDGASSVETVATSWYSHIKKLVSDVCSCCTVSKPIAIANRNAAICPVQTGRLFNCSGPQPLMMKVQFEVTSPIELTNLRWPVLMNIALGEDWEIQGSGAFSYKGICVDGPFYSQTCHGQTGFDAFIQFTTGLCKFEDGQLIEKATAPRETSQPTQPISSSDVITGSTSAEGTGTRSAASGSGSWRQTASILYIVGQGLFVHFMHQILT